MKIKTLFTTIITFGAILTALLYASISFANSNLSHWSTDSNVFFAIVFFIVWALIAFIGCRAWHDSNS